MTESIPNITLTAKQRDAVVNVGADCLGDLASATQSGYLDREISGDLRQMLAELRSTGSGQVELAVVHPQAIRRVFNELMDRAAADTRHPDRRTLIRQARDHVFTVLPAA